MSENNITRQVYQAVRRKADLLLARLADSEPDVREAAAQALGRLGSFESAPALMRTLRDPDRNVRWAAIAALSDLGATDAVPALVELLKDRDAGTREAVAQALGSIGSSESVPALVEHLTDRSGQVRLMTIEALGQIGSTDALEALRKCTESKDETERLCAIEAIEMIRSAGAESLDVDREEAPAPVLSEHPSLARFSEGLRGTWEPWEKQHVRGCDFCQRLVAIEWKMREPEVETLAAYAADPAKFAYQAAMERHIELDGCRRCGLLLRTNLLPAWAALIGLGKEIKIAARAVWTGLPQPQELAPPEEHVGAYETAGDSSLTLHQGEGGSLLVFADIPPKDAATGQVMIEMIGEQGHRAQSLKALTDERISSVREARREFGEDVALLVASASRESLEQLAAWMGDPDAAVRLAAAKAVAALGVVAATPKIIDQLLAQLGDPVSDGRYAAAAALGRMGTTARQDVLEGLLNLLHDSDESMRCAVADALGQVAPTASLAVIFPELAELLRDPDERVRKAAEEALARLR